MTALERYRRLEALGLWHDGPDAQRREVVVSLGDATLMIVATPNETALSHWSLAAVERLNPGRRPAVYAPGADADERLEIDDAQMIEAIETLRNAIARSGPHPGRLRMILGGAFGLGALALAVFWLPDALIRQTVSLLPEAKRVEIGEALLTEITQLAGRPCDAHRGQTALVRLTARSFGDDPQPQVVMLPSAIPDTVALPGGIIAASAALVEDFETPEVLAGYLLAEDVRRAARDPVLTLLEQAGLRVTFRLLTTGEIGDAPLHAHAARLLSRPEPPVDETALIARFAEADLSTEPYAYARDVSGESVLGLIEADPMRGTAQAPLLSDADWVSLQDICANG